MNTADLITTFPWDNYPPLNSLKILDLACGSGRNGLWFAKRGADVTFVDRNPEAFSSLLEAFPHCHCLQVDLESGSLPALGQFDVVLVFNYLHRPLMPWINQRLANGGLLFYETFHQRQAALGKPTNPDFLLQDTELLRTFAKLETLHYFEGKLIHNNTQSQEKAQLIARNAAKFDD
ncbi:class I SAM-dependent methyltransferase [Shewanella dokdonensis]|uniref:Class I SAM-dependent methyltransferase n=1 Tax=Shewanella dokdonensis TaxID=712036 RepID=A0ABX8DD75_9GAMM|nr:class I SAM-dependent methyltransferase [Shewanella dokdonensis]MCL1074631.1 class I SAM-dependent methyltransferase [Shewanella dokdonensis]QVK22370.1 class I SAM-dependent methyltransferase [Shewanella dokdonensis]